MAIIERGVDTAHFNQRSRHDLVNLRKPRVGKILAESFGNKILLNAQGACVLVMHRLFSKLL